MNILSKKTMSLLFVASMLFANGLAMEKQPGKKEVGWLLEGGLHEACWNGRLEKVKELLKHPNIDVNKGVVKGKETPLDAACAEGHVEVVKELLKHKDIDVNKGECNKRGPLFWTCVKNNLKIVEALLKHPKIDVNKGDDNGETPLYIACYKGHIEIVKVLLKHPKIDVNKGDKSRNTPLHFVCWKGCLGIVKLLLGHQNIGVNKENNLEETPLHDACCQGRLEVVKVLLAFGVDPRIKNKDGKTALDIARGKGNQEIIIALLNPLVTAICCPGPVGVVRAYIEKEFPFFDLYKKHEYKVGKETRDYFLIHIAELMLEKFEDGLTKPFLQDEKKIELKENVVKIKEIIKLLKTLLPSFRKELKKARDGCEFYDCVVVEKKDGLGCLTIKL